MTHWCRNAVDSERCACLSLHALRCLCVNWVVCMVPTSQTACRNFALMVFKKADDEDRAGRATK